MVTACATADLTTITVTNKFSAVIKVWPDPATSMLTQVEINRNQYDAFTVATANAAFGTIDAVGDGAYRLLPNATGTFRSPHALRILMDVEKSDTVVSYGVRVLSDWIRSKLINPQQALRIKIGNCAKEVGTSFASQNRSDWREWLSAGFTTVLACKGLAESVPQPGTQTATSAAKLQVTQITKKITNTMWDDALRFVGNAIRLT